MIKYLQRLVIMFILYDICSHKVQYILRTTIGIKSETLITNCYSDIN